MAKYVFLEREGGSFGPYKSAYTFLSLLIVTVMLFFCLTTRVDLLSTHSVHSLSRLSGFSILFFWQTTIIGTACEAVWLLVLDVSLLESESKASEFSESMSTLAGLYLLLELLRLILSISLYSLTTEALLAYANLQCHTLIHLFPLTK